MSFGNEQLVEVGGHRLTLAVDFRILDGIEDLTGQQTPEVLASLSGAQVGAMSRVAWAMLKRHHPELTLDGVAGLLLGAARQAVADAMFDLLTRAMNFAEAKAKAERSEAKWNIREFLVEWVALGGTPSEFWKQTPRSYVAIMEGLAKRANRATDLAIVTAWHTAIFGLNGYAGKLSGKKLSDFLTGQPATRESNHAQAIAFFHDMKARGFPIEITRH